LKKLKNYLKLQRFKSISHWIHKQSNHLRGHMIQIKDINYLVAKDDIKTVISNYFLGLDRSDSSLVKNCFTKDVISQYDGRSAVRPGTHEDKVGIDQLMKALVTFDRHKSGEWKITTHFMGNVNLISLDTNLSEAETETNAIAFIVINEKGVDKVLMRSLRYLDRLRKTNEGWKIFLRNHTLDWSTESPTNFYIEMAKRKMKI